MQSDALFYELFQTAPQIFFELVQITPTCAYRFESITVKTAEKRIDGVLRPFTVDNEYQVRQNLPQWVENIHHIPGLTPDAEERLLTVLLQLIEQRFPHLSYKELSQMLQLTPFKETQSYRETVHEDFTTTLLRHIKRKYGFGERTLTQLAHRFEQLRVEDLQMLFEDILEIKTLSQLNKWLDAHSTNEANPIREGSG